MTKKKSPKPSKLREWQLHNWIQLFFNIVSDIDIIMHISMLLIKKYIWIITILMWILKNHYLSIKRCAYVAGIDII